MEKKRGNLVLKKRILKKRIVLRVLKIFEEVGHREVHEELKIRRRL